ncbi:MAG: class I tRNA ligase family protein, partial [Gammaproteobacteria bacterium]|nr:class I tRNA ligase family protein [Gammaproteobacteria bacterium]
FHTIYQKLHNFCTVEMGSFYLDVIKDRQYTMQTDSLARRSAQTAMYYILQALVRWLAPILSFTAEEIWQHLPDKSAKSVFLSTWYDNFVQIPAGHPMQQNYWRKLMQIRDAVNRELEKARNDGQIGSALGADVTLYCEPELLKELELLGDELRFVFITATATLAAIDSRPGTAVATEIDGLWLTVAASTQKKCIRCWHYRVDVGSNKEHPELCSRCVTNVAGAGEERLYA